MMNSILNWLNCPYELTLPLWGWVLCLMAAPCLIGLGMLWVNLALRSALKNLW